jgi:Domain of unknown function (DUF4287)/Domain of unknown function (DUF5655)
MTDAPRGPAAYFPAIEAKYGRSIAEWTTLMRATGLTSHKELVTWLEEEHGMGHGHANALTAHLLKEGAPRESADDQVARLFPDRKAHWRPVYDALVETINGFGEVNVLPKRTLVGFGTRSQFVMLQPSTPDRFDVGVKVPGVAPTDRFAAAGSWNTMMTHRVQLSGPDEVDAELLSWLRAAYEASL